MKIATIILAATFASVTVNESEALIHTSRFIADSWRIVAFTLAGATLGFLVLILYKFNRLRMSRDDELGRLAAWLAVSHFLLVLFSALEVVNRVGNPVITYRTPLAFVAFVIGFPVMWKIKRRLSEAMILAKKTDASIKLTITDTSKPGPDVDLMRATETSK
jgi:hypothetical protein